jgi:hypothetical protein
MPSAPKQVFFARLRPLSRSKGAATQRLHIFGTLFIGGDRPLWYRVDAATATKLRDARLDNGVAPFEVYDEAEKVKIEQREQERFMVAAGLMAEAATQPAARAAVDLTAPKNAPPAAREAALPASDDEAEVDQDDPLVPVGGGDMTTSDLRR